MFNAASANIFVIVYSSSVLPGMVPWFIILISELNFRRNNPAELKDHPFKMPLYTAYNYFSLIALSVILLFMFFNPDTRISVSVGAVFLVIMSIIYKLRTQRQDKLA